MKKIIIIMILLSIFVSGFDTVSHKASEIKAGTFSGDFSFNGTIENTGRLRSTSAGEEPTNGTGLEMYYDTVFNRARIYAYNRTGSKDMDLALGRLPNHLMLKNNGNVGIGTINPEQKLTVSDNITSGESRYTSMMNNLRYNYTNGAETAAIVGLTEDRYPSTNNRYNMGGYFLSRSYVPGGNNNTGGDVALRAIANLYGNGTLAKQYAIKANGGIVSGNGTIINSYLGYFNMNTVAGATIKNGYGIYIGDIAGNNQYGIYQTDTGASNYFAGNVGIGTTTPNSKLNIFTNVGGAATIGSNNVAPGDVAIAMGISSNSSGYGSIAMGFLTKSTGMFSIALGESTLASGGSSTAMGSSTQATGPHSTAMGGNTIASAQSATAMGIDSIASAYASTAMGKSVANGGYSTAMGISTANGLQATSMGFNTVANAKYSTTMGEYTNASSYASLVIGRYNVGGGNMWNWYATEPIFEIGIGSDDSHKANAMTVLKNGNVGIGTTTPARKLHISDAMRLEPITNPPSNPSQGDLYFDDSDALCVYVTAGWAQLAGSGSCS